MADLNEFDTQVEVAELRQALVRTQRQLAESKARSARLIEAVYTAAHDAAVTLGPAPKVTRPKRDKRTRRELVALLHLTDWQRGKRTGSYDSDTCDRRVLAAVDRAIECAEVKRSAHPVRRCVVMFGGDMVEGTGIFPSQAWEVDATLYEQLFGCARLIENVVRKLRTAFEQVDMWAIHGNHGRIGRKGENPALDNVDRMAYRIAADRLDASFHVPDSWHQIVGVGNYQALLVHGDQIKSFGGNIPAYGVVKKANAWAAGVLDPFHDVYVGHFHTHQTLALSAGGRVFMTGSTESGSEYAREFVAATGVPSQRLHFVDPDRGRVVSEWRLELGDVA